MYEKALLMQLREEARRAMDTLSLEEKFKDPNSAESKALAAMIVTIVTTHAIEAAVAKIMAELHYLRESAAKDNKRQPDPQQYDARPRSTENKIEAQPLNLIELENRLGVVNGQIKKLRNSQAELKEQQEKVFEQIAQIHGDEIREAFQAAGISSIPQEAVEAFNEINAQKAKPLDVDIILRSQQRAHEEAVEKAKAVGAPPPPPPFMPPREQFKQRAKQAREPSWDAALGGAVVFALQGNPVFKASLLEFIYRQYPNEVIYDRKDSSELSQVVPHRITNVAASLKALRYLRPLFARQVHDRETLHQHFDGENERIQALLFGALNEQMALEQQIYQRSSYPGAPVFLATMFSVSPLFGQNGSSSSVDQDEKAKQEDDAKNGPSLV